MTKEKHIGDVLAEWFPQTLHGHTEFCKAWKIYSFNRHRCETYDMHGACSGAGDVGYLQLAGCCPPHRTSHFFELHSEHEQVGLLVESMDDRLQPGLQVW